MERLIKIATQLWQVDAEADRLTRMLRDQIAQVQEKLETGLMAQCKVCPALGLPKTPSLPKDPSLSRSGRTTCHLAEADDGARS